MYFLSTFVITMYVKMNCKATFTSCSEKKANNSTIGVSNRIMYFIKVITLNL